MLVKCDGCGNDFDCSTRKYNFNKKNNFKLFCSSSCYYSSKEKDRVLTNCANCGNPVSKPKSQSKQSKTGNLYCSRSCSAANNNKLFKKWENHPSYKNGISGYRNLKLKSIENPKCEKCGFDNITALDIHHKDRDRKNNTLDNLQILCCNCHMIEHRSKNEDVV